MLRGGAGGCGAWCCDLEGLVGAGEGGCGGGRGQMRASRAGGGRRSDSNSGGQPATELHGSVAVRHGRGDLFAYKAPRRTDRIGPVVRHHASGSKKKPKRKGPGNPRGSFEFGLSSKEPVVSRGAPKLYVKQRSEVVAQLERTGQGCSIMRVGRCCYASSGVAERSDAPSARSPEPSLL